MKTNIIGLRDIPSGGGGGGKTGGPNGTVLLHLQIVFVFVLFCNVRVTRRHSHLRSVVYL